MAATRLHGLMHLPDTVGPSSLPFHNDHRTQFYTHPVMARTTQSHRDNALRNATDDEIRAFFGRLIDLALNRGNPSPSYIESLRVDETNRLAAAAAARAELEKRDLAQRAADAYREKRRAASRDCKARCVAECLLIHFTDRHLSQSKSRHVYKRERGATPP